MLYYTSFLNPTEGTKDIFNSDKLDEVMFFNDKIEINEKGTSKNAIIEYKLNRTTNPAGEEIFIEGTCKDFSLSAKKVIDAQTLTDEAAKEVYEQKLIDSANCIKEGKDFIKSEISSKIIENGAIALNTTYNAFGFVLSKGIKVGTFESLELKTNNLGLREVFSICELSNVESLSIEFYTQNGYKGTAEVRVTNSGENKFNYSNLKISKEAYDGDFIPKSEYDDEGEYCKARKDLLNLEKETQTLSVEEFDDIF